MYQSSSALRRISRYLPCFNRDITAPALSRCFASARKPFVERDLVILRLATDPSAPPVLTKPLSPEGSIQTHKGVLKHSDIIGKYPRDIVQSNINSEYRLHEVSLDEYVRLSKRLVTPIYPADANLIVSLFDFHVSPPSSARSTEGPSLEFLEAGTGHGALTLHLSRAIHAANYPKPSQDELKQTSTEESPEADQSEDQDATTESDPLSAWKDSRRAVIHTIDVSPKYSKHARKVVRGFRHGLYADNVDFHVGDVSEWVKSEQERRAHSQLSADSSTEDTTVSTPETPLAPFLTHAFLDLPSTHKHLATVASALHTDGILVIFNPSVTQIAECLQLIKSNKLPLYLETTLELGQNGTSGGKEWDVRVVKPRAGTKKGVQATPESVEPNTDDSVVAEAEKATDDAWSLVCRPKVGERVIGGGFLGVFRRMKH